MKLGLIGTDISSSLSPEIHNRALKIAGLPGDYSLVQIAPNKLGNTLKQLHLEGYFGLNVTAPYKTDVLSFCGDQSELVESIHSTNTLVRTKSGWHAESTDGAGILFALNLWEGKLGAKKALILGGGGFARAAAFALLQSGWQVEVCLRQLNKNWNALALQYRHKLALHSWDSRVELCGQVILVINATPIGSDGKSSPLPLDRKYNEKMRFVDAIYTPRTTPILEYLDTLGLTVQNGFNILFGQAIASFKLWTGKTVSVKEIVSGMEGLE